MNPSLSAIVAVVLWVLSTMWVMGAFSGHGDPVSFPAAILYLITYGLPLTAILTVSSYVARGSSVHLGVRTLVFVGVGVALTGCALGAFYLSMPYPAKRGAAIAGLLRTFVVPAVLVVAAFIPSLSYAGRRG